MANLSWNEIQNRATEFSAKWAGETYEKGESQSFWSEFLQIFGVDRRRHGAFFEYAIKKGSGKQGFIDMFWPSMLLAEQKSGGKDLDKASLQAYEYLATMPDHDLPQAIVVSDFASFIFIKNDGTNQKVNFKLEDLSKNVKLFGFLIEQKSKHLAEEDPVNVKAAEAMARLHNQLRDDNYTGHDLELLLVRLVFCMFADDSGIFEQGLLSDYLTNRTSDDGSDLGSRLLQIFEILNTNLADRQTSLDEALASLPYVNGGLFGEPIRTPSFTASMRSDLLKAMELDWSKVSPAIFGSMFQGVMDEKQRRNLGAHYTSEKNILRVIKPLFLDDLYDEFAKAAAAGPRKKLVELAEFQKKIAKLKFLDPACGCGNFLVITYRELRRLEHKVVAMLSKDSNTVDMLASAGEGVGSLKVNVDQMYGIEIEEFPSLIAQTALWLTDHQMNVEYSKQSGKTFKRLPLTRSATIVNDNALTKDWAEVVAPNQLNFILGNPPFIGHQWRSAEQADIMTGIWGIDGACRRLDFVTCWFKKATEIMQKNSKVQTALVSTNSISQGEQVSPLWKTLFAMGVHINFAHRTFQWKNDAKGVAGVHCVISGFSLLNRKDKRIFDYTDIKGDPIETKASNINGYLTNAPNVFISSRSSAPEGVPELVKGSQPTDGGNLIMTEDERNELITTEPLSEQYIRQYVGGAEFINNKARYCLWLKDANPNDLRQMPNVAARIEKVRQTRLQSPTKSVQEFASYPSLFTQDRQPESDYLAIPEVSSERREYIPIGYLSKDIVASNKLQIIREPNKYLFGLLMSKMHMVWMRTVAGRLESRYSYSPSVFYSFIQPEPTEADKQAIENLAQAVLDARAEFPNASLADLYDPLSMPPSLAKAHKQLDKAVDKLYQKQPFKTDSDRVALLFKLYQKAVSVG
ncbi:class I SAM-dependent DNA methyltransferase [Candidatus Saccharibacteria bacterium]|nr:class I SAM-dependent DNA methyltransferase [Candidatus Saccharibacteria bacterium]